MSRILDWDPALLARADGLDWRSRVLVAGFLQGAHRSTLRGYSAEFAQYHPYIQGDDPRFLDWKAYARFDRLYIREFDAETNVRMQVVVDGSGSMDWKSERAPWRKYDYACLLAAALMRLARSGNDAFGLSIAGQTLSQHLPARLDRGHFLRALGQLEAHRPAGEGRLGRCLEQLGELLRPRGAVVVLSDAWDDLDGLFAGLKRLRYDHHDCCLLQVVDPAELSFDFTASQLFEDAETGLRLPITPAWNRSRYLERLREHQERLAEGCRTLAVQHRVLASDEPPFHALAELLAQRGR